MHNLHFILIKADSAAKAASKAENLILDWGNENNWRCVGGIASEDGSDDIENHDEGAWGLPPSQWEAAPPAGNDPGKKPYSVLLLYPDYANDGGTETYYAFVEAPDQIEAVALAQRQAVAANECVEIEPDDFAPLLVTQGHHVSEPLFNK